MFIQGAKGGVAAEFAPLLGVLVELGDGQVTSDQVSRIRGLLAALRDKFQDSIALLTDNENQSITEFLAR